MRSRSLMLISVMMFLAVFYLVYHTFLPYKAFYSSSIEESVKNGLYLVEYEVQSISHHRKNDFCDCLTNAKIWKEKEQLKRQMFLFSGNTKVKFNEVLIVKPPTCSRWNDVVSFPYIRLRDQKYSGVIRENKIIALEKASEKIDEIESLTVYDDRSQDICTVTIKQK